MAILEFVCTLLKHFIKCRYICIGRSDSFIDVKIQCMSLAQQKDASEADGKGILAYKLRRYTIRTLHNIFIFKPANNLHLFTSLDLKMYSFMLIFYLFNLIAIFIVHNSYLYYIYYANDFL